jgi:NAD(P)-dependent dehydrogenase (short-subunit alcohol dehydrogenase family)
MSDVFAKGEVAVITGGASGIGRAAARHCAKAGMRIVLIDVNDAKLAATRDELADVVGFSHLDCELASVADFAAMRAVAGRVEREWGAPALLMNNAAGFVAGGAGGILDPLENCRGIIDTNVFGVIHGVQAFLPGMLKAGKRARIVNTGSKQGLTNPPGNPAYNVSKAAVNAYTQNLARDLRERPQSKVSAHLLVPGWTTTGDAEHRPGAWLPEQVIDMLVKRLERDAFWIVCPDDETTTEMDNKRVLWNALDLILGRPALSRWHPDYKDAFAAFMKKDMPRDLMG